MIKEKCSCGLNPNDYQDEEQQQYELQFIREYGMCESCYQEQE